MGNPNIPVLRRVHIRCPVCPGDSPDASVSWSWLDEGQGPGSLEPIQLADCGHLVPLAECVKAAPNTLDSAVHCPTGHRMAPLYPESPPGSRLFAQSADCWLCPDCGFQSAA
jgi:hypothetical protein